MSPPLRGVRAGVISAAALGILASSGHTAGMALMCLMPVLTMAQTKRRDAVFVTASYYAGATWPVIPAARNFFGPDPPIEYAVPMWIGASSLLAAPWAAAWTTKRPQLLWRVPLGLAISAVPPLGIIGWASPLCSAGLLFPGTGWLGLIVTAILPAICLIAPRATILLTLMLTAALNATWQPPAPPRGWEAVNTNFGGISHGGRMPAAQFASMHWLQERARESRARVIVFPETVLPMWTDATELFWQQTLAELRASGKAMLIGAGIPTSSAPPRIDFSAELAALRDEPPIAPHAAAQNDVPSYWNAALILGTQTGTFLQRIPVPLGMWRPLGRGGVPLRLFGSGIAEIAGERAAILICYEQLLVWPVLESMTEHPTAIIAIANDHWVMRTPIPRWQAAAVAAWARLFGMPCVSAMNR